MDKSRWMLYTKRADFDSLAARFHVDPVITRIIINRGVKEEDINSYIYGSLADMHDAHLLSDCDKSVDIIKNKINAGKTIRIVGDYDIDGICATYILYTALLTCGAKVDYEIPDRIKDGYGINEQIIDAAYNDKIDTIITCDNGIAAIDALAKAKQYDMTVVITDHHDIRKEDGSDIVPDVDAIVNPKRSDDSYPFKSICGAMVAYKLVSILYERCKIPKKKWDELLPYAAIATVGDVMPLMDENRIAVKEGLKAINDCDNLGLRELIRACNLDLRRLTAYSIGFVVGPCLNAGGRLESAKTALRLLITEDEDEAVKLARHLTMLNGERKDMTTKGCEEAYKQVEESYSQDDVLVLYLPDCHESIAGIIAGRVREHYNKPSIVLTRTEDGLVKGSGRSIEAYPMFDKLCEVSDLLTKFGGHPMAAGMSLQENNITEFRNRLNKKSGLKTDDFINNIWIDAAMPFDYITEQLIDQLNLLEPFGNGNEKPAFAQKDIRIANVRVMGKDNNVVKLDMLSTANKRMEGLIFTDGREFIEEMGDNKIIDIIYYPQVNEYMGRKTLQVVIRGWKFK